MTLVVAGVATTLGKFFPIVGGPLFGILIGLVAGTAVTALRGDSFSSGYTFASKPVLQASVVVLGTGLSIRQVLNVGGSSLPVMLGTVAVSLIGAYVIGRALGLDSDVRTLIGVGTAICGASAIAAATAVIKPKQADVAYAIGTIFTFNIAAVLLFPPIGHLIGMSGHSFGLWSGTAVNDISSVVAAAYSFGDGAGPYALVVKLTRSLMIIPIVMTLSLLYSRRQARAGGEITTSIPWQRVVPPFLIGFLLAAVLDSLGVIPAGWHSPLNHIGTFMITMALAGIGLSMRLGQMRAAGVRPLLLGGALWLCVALSSLGLQWATGTI
ncbi:putative sulfate exporter family transporter [Dermatophilaceae bacterium Sec6.4]